MSYSRWRRLAAVAVTLASVATAACTADAAPRDLVAVSVLTGAGQQPWESWLDIAEVDGLFAAEGLDVTVHPGGGTGRNLTLLESGESDFATADVATTAIEFAKGLDPEWRPAANRPEDTGHINSVLTALLHHDLMAAIVSRKELGIVEPRDLAGRSVAIIPGGNASVLLSAIATESGLDIDSVTQVPASPDLYSQLLAKGEVDAAVAFVPEIVQMEAALGPLNRIVYSDVLVDPPPGSAIAVTREFADSHPEIVRAFGRAAAAALQTVKDDPARAGRVWWSRHSDQTAWDEPLAVEASRVFAAYLAPEAGLALGEIDEARVMRAIATLDSVGALPAAEFGPDDIARFDLAR